MQPNILFLTIDSLRSDKIYGNNKSPLTPNFDRLIKNGTYCSQAISTSDATGLSIGSLITGIYPFKTGITHFSYNPEIQTFFQIFQENGYNTYATIPDSSFFLKMKKNFSDVDYYVYDKRESWLQLSGGIGTQIIERLENKLSGPWLYYIHLMDLHAPFNVPKKFNSKKYGETEYDQMISLIDFWIGKFLEKINFDNTILIISSDHGDYISTIKNWNEPLKTNSLLKTGKKYFPILESTGVKFLFAYQNMKRKNKINKLKKNLSEKETIALVGRGQNHLYDELVRIPLIFTGSGISSNKIISTQVKQVDIFPTLADHLDIILKNDCLDGDSLIPLFNNKRFTETPAYIETGSRNPKTEKNPTLHGNIVGIRTSKYKYWRSRDDSSKNVTLFDLEKDPQEENNISVNNPDVVISMEKIITNMKKNSFINENKLVTENEVDIEEELRKMGYM